MTVRNYKKYNLLSFYNSYGITTNLKSTFEFNALKQIIIDLISEKS